MITLSLGVRAFAKVGLAQTAATQGPEPRAPALLSPPVLSGPAGVGARITASPGIWSGWPPPALTFQWARDGVDIPGADGAYYMPVAADAQARMSCAVTAGNASGQARAVSASLAVAQAPPERPGRFDDSFPFQDSGVFSLNISSGITGAALNFTIEGEGVSIDPASGILSITTETLRAGVDVVVIATNADGAAESQFRLTVALPETLPVPLVAPQLDGTGRIGDTVTLDPGRWGGSPLPQTAIEWLCNGVPIAGATELVYIPQAAEDGTELSARVTATNAVGSVTAETGLLSVRNAPPVAAGALSDLVLDAGTPSVQVAAGSDFAGEMLVFAVSGAGAAIDSASGLVTIGTDTVLDDELITVTASNSGGSAQSDFRVDVEPVAPALVEAPVLAGPGHIGVPLVVETGHWSGAPVPAVHVQWLRAGAQIAGATDTHYTPGPADDRSDISCQVMVTNAGGLASAVTEPVTVTYAAPEVSGFLVDVEAQVGDAVLVVEAAAAFTGQALRFAVTGAHATVDALTGRISIPADTALDAAQVTVTARNSGGMVQQTFTATIKPRSRPPLLVSAPTLAGEARIGQTLTLVPGVWSGLPLSVPAVQWLRDGVEIDGATGMQYTLTPDDDLAAITGRVTATNLAGHTTVLTAALTATHVAPVRVQALADEVFDVDTGTYQIHAAPAFEGSALRFSVLGGEATVDAQTGVITIPTDSAQSDAVSEDITVFATNSGGQAHDVFRVTFEDPDRPFALEADDVEVVGSVWRPVDQDVWFAPRIRFPGLEGESVDAIEWTTNDGTSVPDHQCEVVLETGRPGEYQPFMRDAARNAPGASPRVDFSVWRNGRPRQTQLRFRWRRAADGKWSPLSVALTVPAPGTSPTTDVEWRPFIRRYPHDLGVAHVDQPAHYMQGRYGGDGFQYSQGAAVSTDGSVLLMSQDMGFCRKAEASGPEDWAIWRTPVNNGLWGIGGNGCAIDPVGNERYLFACTTNGMGSIYTGMDDADGLYLTTDGARSWTQVLSLPGMAYNERYHKEPFCCWPLSDGDPTERRWLFAGLNRNADGGIWRSVDGGQAWEQISTLSHALHRVVIGLVQHPGEQDTVFLCSKAGLHRSENGGVTWKPASDFWDARFAEEVRALWIDPDAHGHILVSVTSGKAALRGLWETHDNGDTWERLLGDINPGNFGVGAKNDAGARLIFVHDAKAAGAPRVRMFDGRWIEPGFTPQDADEWAYKSLTGQKQCCALFHPTDPQTVLLHGRNCWWVSRGNEASKFVDSNTHYWGAALRGASFNEADWKKIYFAAQDVGYLRTHDGGDTLIRGNIGGPKSTAGSQYARMVAMEKGINKRSGRAVAVLPDPWPAGVPAAAHADAVGRKVLCLGDTEGQFIFTQDKKQEDTVNGAEVGVWSDRIEDPVASGGGISSRQWCDYSRQDPNVVYAGANVSTDGALTWEKSAKVITGMSFQNGDIVYSVDDVSANDWRIYKSIDRGNTWVQIYQSNKRLKDTGGAPLLTVDPHSDDRLYVQTGFWHDGKRHGDALLLRLEGDAVTAEVELDLRSQYALIPPGMHLKRVAVDWQDPRLVYVLMDVSGAPTFWRLRMKADFSGVESYEDLTRNAPRVARSTDLFVHPVTGDVLYCSGNGNHVYPAPDDWEHRDPAMRVYKRAMWDNMPLPFANDWKDA